MSASCGERNLETEKVINRERAICITIRSEVAKSKSRLEAHEIVDVESTILITIRDAREVRASKLREVHRGLAHDFEKLPSDEESVTTQHHSNGVARDARGHNISCRAIPALNGGVSAHQEIAVLEWDDRSCNLERRISNRRPTDAVPPSDL